MIPVDYGIPVPKSRAGTMRPRYPWATMRVGGSFFLPCTPALRAKVRNCVSSAASAWSHGHGGHFTTRQVEGGIRVWRTRGDSD